METPYQTAARLKAKYQTPDPDLEPKVVCVKVIPRAEPNADGVWRKVVAEPRHLNPRKHGDDKRQTMWDALLELVGPDEFVASYTSDLRYDGKPGNWLPNQKD